MIHAAVVIPPMSNLNAPYAAGPVLAGWLGAQGARVTGLDASLALARALYARSGVERLFAAIDAEAVPAAWRECYANRRRYAACVDAVVAFLDGRDPGLAGRIVRQSWLPQGPRFVGTDPEAEREAFGSHGIGDQARWLATKLIQDLADLWRATIAPHFNLTSYGDRLAESASSFDPLADYLATPLDPVETILAELLAARLPQDLDLVLLTCPFPGNLPGALRIAQWLRRERPGCRVVLGGGYPSTELRELRDPRPFDLVDGIVLDDGAHAVSDWLAICAGEARRPRGCFVRVDTEVVFTPVGEADPRPFAELPAPDYAAFPLTGYLDLVDSLNPAHRLWNEGRWLKLTAAQGCYWQRCTFCDTTLPYIADYQPLRGSALADRMDALAAQTGHHGFHLTDEAAPPAQLLRLAETLLARGRGYQWWGNIRFDGYFTPDRCRVLAAGGMVAVTGGIEVAEPRVLERVDKGVDLPQLVRVCRAFAEAGILVHGYLMYGFPGQSVQEVIDSAEIVRQMMAAGILHSGFWHRFTLTAHSPIGADPAAYGCTVTGPAFAGFARNNLEHVDAAGVDYEALGPGLAAALAAWMRGAGLDADPRAFFAEADLPAPRIGEDFVATLMAASPPRGRRPCWLGEEPELTADGLRLVDEHGDLHEWRLPALDAQALRAALAASRPGVEGSGSDWREITAQTRGCLEELGLCWL